MYVETSSGWHKIKHLPFRFMIDIFQGVVGGVTGIITKPVEGRLRMFHLCTKSKKLICNKHNVIATSYLREFLILCS